MVEENKNVIKSQFIFYNTKSQQTALLSCFGAFVWNRKNGEALDKMQANLQHKKIYANGIKKECDCK